MACRKVNLGTGASCDLEKGHDELCHADNDVGLVLTLWRRVVKTLYKLEMAWEDGARHLP